MLIDSHCHIGHMFTPEEQSAAIDRARAAGVDRLISLATCLGDGPKHLALAAAHDGVFACCGIHPCDVHEAPDDFETALRQQLADPKCVAVGETGLDYYHPAPDGWSAADYHARQADLLRRHFRLAAELDKNIVIHTRDRSGQASLDDALAIYADFADRVTAVFHCFIGNWNAAQPVLALGGLLSFTGIATFKKATEVLDTATRVPAGAIMVETDAPFLAPMPHRGKRCEPAYTRLTAEHIAAARGESIETFAAHTTATAEAFFKL